jgi:chaperonin GroES
LGDRVVVKRLEAQERTKGGVYLPDTAKEKPQEGKVVAVGSGRLLDSGERAKPQVKKGDRVIFTAYGGTEVTVDGEEVLILNEEDILAVVGK